MKNYPYLEEFLFSRKGWKIGVLGESDWIWPGCKFSLNLDSLINRRQPEKLRLNIRVSVPLFQSSCYPFCLQNSGGSWKWILAKEGASKNVVNLAVGCMWFWRRWRQWWWWWWERESFWMQHVEIPVPVVKKDYVLIRVEAVSINPHDWKIQDGYVRHVLPPRFPHTPGNSFTSFVHLCFFSRQVQTEKKSIEGCRGLLTFFLHWGLSLKFLAYLKM